MAWETGGGCCPGRAFVNVWGLAGLLRQGLRFGASVIKPSQLPSWLIQAVRMIIQLARTRGHKEEGSKRRSPFVLVFDNNCNEPTASGTYLICLLLQDYHLEWHFVLPVDLSAVFSLSYTVFLFTKLAHQSFGVQSLAVTRDVLLAHLLTREGDA